MSTRYAIRIDRPYPDGVEPSWIFRLDRYTNPAWTQDSRVAMTWASRHSAKKQAERYHITNFTIEGVQR